MNMVRELWQNQGNQGFRTMLAMDICWLISSMLSDSADLFSRCLSIISVPLSLFTVQHHWETFASFYT
jgi:hypothetical protein